MHGSMTPGAPARFTRRRTGHTFPGGAWPRHAFRRESGGRSCTARDGSRTRSRNHTSTTPCHCDSRPECHPLCSPTASKPITGIARIAEVRYSPTRDPDCRLGAPNESRTCAGMWQRRNRRAVANSSCDVIFRDGLTVPGQLLVAVRGQAPNRQRFCLAVIGPVWLAEPEHASRGLLQSRCSRSPSGRPCHRRRRCRC